MLEVDRLTDKQRKSIITLLNTSLKIEYTFVVNYPRLIDQIVNIDRLPAQEAVKGLERLGKQSVQHFGWTGQLIQRLGGSPEWQIDVIDRMVDVVSLLTTQLEREDGARSLYQQAKKVAQEQPSKGALGKLKSIEILLSGSNFIERSSVIAVLERLVFDEEDHISLVKKIIADLKPPASGD
ncbi:MAG: hypothetical protein V3S82_09395 [Dehalococcoidia bacterium]